MKITFYTTWRPGLHNRFPDRMLMVDKEADNKQHTKTTAPRYSEAWKHGRNVHSFMLLYT